MKAFLYWKIPLIAVVLGLSIWLAYPYDRQKINLGLDLQGGMHLVLEVEAEKAVEATLERYVSEVREGLRKREIDFDTVRREVKGHLQIRLFDAAAKATVEAVLAGYPDLERRPDLDGQAGRVAKGDGLLMAYALKERVIRRIQENAVDQGLETIRNRVDQFGIAEPAIQRQGVRRIIVELPGVKDPERALQLIGKTALLEFKLVDDKNSLEEALAGKIPDGDEILYEQRLDRRSGETIKRPYLVRKQTLMTGEAITNAAVQIESQFNEPYVSVSFDKPGANLFAQITGEHVKERLAIVLDGNVYSAPVIQEKISGGQAQITGSFTPEAAHDLAIVLRAGALPAPVRILENRTVGPSLGQDSIRKGVLAALIGAVVIMALMGVYYRLCGLLADLTLLLNQVILLGVLAYFHATLTLPGIAGIVLNIGMAVDANVLIFERIREELEVGKTARAAVDAGFDRAFWTIMDANLTTLIAALLLFQFGTGPVKGFAVTLTIGILATLFTQLFVCRVIFGLVLSRPQVRRLSI